MNRISQVAVVTLLSFLAASCSESTPTSPSEMPNSSSTSISSPGRTRGARRAAAVAARLGEPFSVPVSNTAVVEPAGMIVTFRAVEADSRCATDVTCVWEGEALLSLRLRLGDFQDDFQVSTHPSNGKNSVLFGGLSLRVIDLEPQPRTSDGPIGSRPYRATFIVEVDG